MRGTPHGIFSRAARAACAAALVVCVVAALQQTARAAGVADYRARVVKAAGLLEGLAARRWDYEETFSGARAAATAQTFAEVRALLPRTERVESGAARGGLEVNNGWLHEEIGRCERLRGDAVECAEVLGRAVARLRSIAARLEEYEGAGAAARDKEAEKGRLATILRGPEYAPRGARQSAFERLRERFVNWLRELFPGIGPIRPGTDRRATLAAQLVIYSLIAALIFYVGRRLWQRRRWSVSPVPREEARVVLGERLAPELRAADLIEEAERLARAGNLRGAIRRAYVALLVELGDRRVVRLARHKTNRDYLRAVSERASHLYGLVRPLTDDFERHWYGLEAATEEDWTKFRAGCRRALES